MSNTISEEERIIRKYINKASAARSRGITFNLSLATFKRLWRIKKCYYTNITLTRPIKDTMLPTDATIDRVDSSIGYEEGNVVVCSFAANQFKSYWENQSSNISQKEVVKMVMKLHSRISNI